MMYTELTDEMVVNMELAMVADDNQRKNVRAVRRANAVKYKKVRAPKKLTDAQVEMTKLNTAQSVANLAGIEFSAHSDSLMSMSLDQLCELEEVLRWEV